MLLEPERNYGLVMEALHGDCRLLEPERKYGLVMEALVTVGFWNRNASKVC